MNELLENFRMSHTGGMVLTDLNGNIIGIIAAKNSTEGLIEAIELCISEFESTVAVLDMVSAGELDTNLLLTVECSDNGETSKEGYALTITATY